ncbi:uncharacterized protein PpBr36_05932 [Pyricularia pennisetigena]|uniref:uncharacterized protein n=1 Tax=Pyricularia pennisetigena TaxID=1578925 RepID=UPI001153E9E3|nr:uncharacterized protein PpBr36_05932 [Pyricularia pennisetigena]TLS23288.1 hypothetical protein PpBr36_05932 [Pyricularia pennisetigena]
MPTPSTYALVSLPLRAFDTDDALSALRGTITSDNGSVQPFTIPEFKIGTLDALVQQADDLTKLEAACQGVVSRVADSLKNLLDGDEDKVAQHKTVNDKPTDHYITHFSWNKVRYRADRPLGELIDTMQKELVNIDNDVKGKFTQYNSTKSTMAALQRKQTGNLATKSLTPIVKPSLLVQDSEYLETHLIAVPSIAKKDFLKSYETIAPMVVPRSSIQVAQDDEFTLFAVTTFKKTAAEFLQKCREQKWTPRQYKYVEGGQEEEKRELERIAKEERKVFHEALRLGRTGWSESVMVWAHVMALRVFVETVLRYGLPLEFVSALIKTNPKLVKKVKTSLDKSFSYLGGNAFGRDKQGKIKQDDAALTSEIAAAGVGFGEGNEYTPYFLSGGPSSRVGLDQALVLQPLDNLSDTLLNRVLMGLDGDFRVLWCLVRGRDAGELLDFSGAGLLVQTLGVALLSDLDGDVDVDLDELERLVALLRGLGVQLPGRLPVGAVRRDEGRQRHDGAVGKQLGHLGDPADVFVAVLFREAQVLVEPEPHVVAVEPVRRQAQVQQVLLQRRRHRRLARRRQPREPDCEAALAAQLVTLAARQAVVPGDVAVFI